MSHISVIWVGNTNIIEVRGLQDALTEDYIASATVEVTIKDAEGVEVETLEGETEQEWPTAMDYVEGSEGIYRAALSHALDMTAGETYYAHIDAEDEDSDGAGVGHWEFAFVAKVRRST